MADPERPRLTRPARLPGRPRAVSEFTEAMAQLAAGVAVVTVRDDRDDLGATGVSALMSVSLEPPLVLVSLAQRRLPREVLLRQDRWAGLPAVSRAGRDRQPVRRRRPAQRPPPGGGHPAPPRRPLGRIVVENGVAALEAETTQVVPAGDHTLFIARVLAVPYVTSTLQPLVRLRGRDRPDGRASRT